MDIRQTAAQIVPRGPCLSRIAGFGEQHHQSRGQARGARQFLHVAGHQVAVHLQDKYQNFGAQQNLLGAARVFGFNAVVVWGIHQQQRGSPGAQGHQIGCGSHMHAASGLARENKGRRIDQWAEICRGENPF